MTIAAIIIGLTLSVGIFWLAVTVAGWINEFREEWEEGE